MLGNILIFLAGLVFRLKETDADYAALRLGNFLFGGGTLSSRLGNRIRQKEGLSYGVTSALSASTPSMIQPLCTSEAFGW